MADFAPSEAVEIANKYDKQLLIDHNAAIYESFKQDNEKGLDSYPRLSIMLWPAGKESGRNYFPGN